MKTFSNISCKLFIPSSMDSVLSFSPCGIWHHWPRPYFWYFPLLSLFLLCRLLFLPTCPLSVILKILTSAFDFSVSPHILFDWVPPSLMLPLVFFLTENPRYLHLCPSCECSQIYLFNTTIWRSSRQIVCAMYKIEFTMIYPPWQGPFLLLVLLLKFNDTICTYIYFLLSLFLWRTLTNTYVLWWREFRVLWKPVHGTLNWDMRGWRRQYLNRGCQIDFISRDHWN